MKDKPWIAWAIHNSVVIICFSALAVIFNDWLITLFALIFVRDIKTEK